MGLEAYGHGGGGGGGRKSSYGQGVESGFSTERKEVSGRREEI